MTHNQFIITFMEAINYVDDDGFATKIHLSR